MILKCPETRCAFNTPVGTFSGSCCRPSVELKRMATPYVAMECTNFVEK